MSNPLEKAKIIVEQGCCANVVCIGCPAENLSRKSGCGFCQNFDSNEDAIAFFEQVIKTTNENDKLKIIMTIVNEVASIPFYAYGDNEAACTMMDAIKKIGDYIETPDKYKELVK